MNFTIFLEASPIFIFRNSSWIHTCVVYILWDIFFKSAHFWYLCGQSGSPTHLQLFQSQMGTLSICGQMLLLCSVGGWNSCSRRLSRQDTFAELKTVFQIVCSFLKISLESNEILKLYVHFKPCQMLCVLQGAAGRNSCKTQDNSAELGIF